MPNSVSPSGDTVRLARAASEIYPAHGPPQFRLPHDAARPSPHSPRQRTEPAHMRSPAGLHQPKRKQKIKAIWLSRLSYLCRESFPGQADGADFFGCRLVRAR